MRHRWRIETKRIAFFFGIAIPVIMLLVLLDVPSPYRHIASGATGGALALISGRIWPRDGYTR